MPNHDVYIDNTRPISQPFYLPFFVFKNALNPILATIFAHLFSVMLHSENVMSESHPV